MNLTSESSCDKNPACHTGSTWKRRFLEKPTPGLWTACALYGVYSNMTQIWHVIITTCGRVDDEFLRCVLLYMTPACNRNILLTHMFWSLEADPAHWRPKATLRIAGEGEPLLQFALWTVIRGAAANAQGRRQFSSIHPARHRPLSARRPCGSCRGRSSPVPRVLVAPRQRVVVVGDSDACLISLRSLAAHGGQRGRGCRWPEQQHPQVTEQDAAAALQHALSAQHHQKLTAGRERRAACESPSSATALHVSRAGRVGTVRGCVCWRLKALSYSPCIQRERLLLCSDRDVNPKGK